MYNQKRVTIQNSNTDIISLDESPEKKHLNSSEDKSVLNDFNLSSDNN